ncbi:DUF72 domain-containing protein [Croceicoccus sp. YJ47]|uniref:DUF72 domain-containing protein n=1 Tax=Croceicoccus sp. YJ47 TaxID=2798724 RepID=UPI001924A302|nr:DUF72 domain-containing protein [Croceicoccus sp. YJ47]QQN74595.1 DUF72 domain-containing protein [Croceicoccus sp. YJ47]
MSVRTGIGGWRFDGWRAGVFYPDDLPRRKELHFASRQVSAIEVNGTYYRLQKPETFAAWRADVPDGFVFALKASRYICNRRKLADAGEAVERFFAQGLTELGDALGPILWQFPDYRAFDAEDLAAFFALLPRERHGLPLRHVMEVQHDSFRCAEFVDLARGHDIAIAYVDGPGGLAMADLSGGLGYMRMKGARSDLASGYDDAALDDKARIAADWDQGVAPNGVNRITTARMGAMDDVYVFVIDGAKERAPAAAIALAGRL